MGRFLKLLKFYFTKKDPAATALITFVRAITNRIPLNLSLYRIALQHSSEGPTSNERLEFLGDAILSAVIATYLFQRYPLREEGFLTEIRSRLVNRDSMNKLACKMHIHKFLHYNTQLIKKGQGKFIYGNALEALIGAVYLDHGYVASQKFIVERLIGNYVSLKNLIENDTNFKSKILQWANKNHIKITFKISTERQYETYREFTAQVLIDVQIIGEGRGRTKKDAEQMAAQQALAHTKEMELSTLYPPQIEN